MRKRRISREFARPLWAGATAGAAVFLLSVSLAGQAVPPTEAALLPPTPAVESAAPDRQGWDGEQTVSLLLAEGEVRELTMEEYLQGVVAAEMPASFEEQALRAQAVCARTYSLWKMSSGRHGDQGAQLCAASACCQAYKTPEELAERWGERGEEYAARIAAAVADTDGWIITYEGQPIQAAFFSSSTASTEDAVEVWGSSLPYLVSVDSPEGDEVPNYRSQVVLTAQEVRELAEESGIGAELSGSAERWLGEVRYTASGRVAELELGGVKLTGGAARSLFGLRSACFTVEAGPDSLTFSVVGYGHGVGMSQYGANAMAAAGADWRSILRHYYTDIELTKAQI